MKRDQADIWFSKCIRARNNWSCECCSKQYDQSSTGLHCAHIYGRANKSTRWDADNACSLCYACHQRFTSHPIDFHEWLRDHMGEGHMDILREKRRAILKTNAALRKEIAAHYRQEYRRMENDGNYTLVNY